MEIIFIFIFLYNLQWYCVNSYLVPKVVSGTEESFVLDDLEYVFSNQRITWEEAEIDCSSTMNGSLAIIDSSEKANFLASALAETDLALEDLWIYSFRENCVEHCTNQGLYVDHIDECINYKCFVWPNMQPVDKDIITPLFAQDETRNCLSFTRNNHQQPSFINLQCSLKRSYLCQKTVTEELSSMTHLNWIQINNYEYAIFYDKKTWQESVTECFRKYKAHLADFRNMNEIAEIGKYLLIGRPSLERAWFGGHFKNGRWKYISIEGAIPNKRDPHTFYPPWSDVEGTVPKQGCLLLDRHLEDTNKLTFKQTRCNRKESYICSRKISDEKREYDKITAEGITYILCFTPKTWEEAKTKCSELDAWLVRVTKERMDNILHIMEENRAEIKHVWIGGKLSANNVWQWVNADEIRDNEIHAIFDGYPPWINPLYNQNYSCLNMDIENHNRPIFYGVHCEVKQPFICEEYPKAEEVEILYDE